MLDRRAVEAEEEAIRGELRALDDAARAAFYRALEGRIRDPDTYATLNYLFILGLHHFYLRRWWRGGLSLGGFFAGLAMIVGGAWIVGVALIGAIALVEFYELLRSQVIVQDHNNRTMRETLEEFRPGAGRRP